jgi:hypothetical protein
MLVLSLAIPVGHAQAPADLVMERPGSPDAAETLIIGGRRVQDTKKWPATFKFGKGVKEFCTATAIGPRVILTAAHCLPNGASGHVVINDKRVGIVCDHHHEYTPCPLENEDPKSCPAGRTTSADYALCLASADLGITEYETVNTKSGVPAVGGRALLTGFGCNEDGGVDKGFGYLFEGDTTVRALPNETGADMFGLYYIVTRGGAALCFGDSGGPSYKLQDSQGKSRVMIGVNSRTWAHLDQASFLSATSVRSFVDWATSWASSKSTAESPVQMCGLHPGLRGCHP